MDTSRVHCLNRNTARHPQSNVSCAKHTPGHPGPNQTRLTHEHQPWRTPTQIWDYTPTTANPISPWPPSPTHRQRLPLEPVTNWMAHWSQPAGKFPPRPNRRNKQFHEPTAATKNAYAALALLKSKGSCTLNRVSDPLKGTPRAPYLKRAPGHQ